MWQILPALCVACGPPAAAEGDPARSADFRQFDPVSGLAWKPGSGPGKPKQDAGTLATAGRLLPLLESGDPDDRALAERAMRALVAHQYDAPGTPHHGTWVKTLGENPPRNSRQWLDFDPNWREFIGATLIRVLEQHADRLPGELVSEVEAALLLAAEGALARELPPDYSNIAINHAYFFAAVGKRLGRPEWVERGERFALDVHALFREHDCFDEFNAPTYYGIDLEGLSRWIDSPPTPLFDTLARDMERRMWLQIARFYHADLRNLCGPFDRAREINLLDNGHSRSLGAFVNAVVGPGEKPFRVGVAPAELTARIPEEAKRHLRAFRGERLVRWQITTDPDRVATAWLGEEVMIGAEDANFAKHIWDQYHMATIHWKLPDGGTGALTLAPTVPTYAVATPGRLRTETYVWAGTGTHDVSFRWKIEAPGLNPDMIRDDRWRLPGLTLDFETNARDRRVRQNGDGLIVSFSGNNRDAGTRLVFDLRVRRDDPAVGDPAAGDPAAGDPAVPADGPAGDGGAGDARAADDGAE